MVEPSIENRNNVGMVEAAQKTDLPSEPPAEILAVMAELQGELAAAWLGLNPKDGPHSAPADHPKHPEIGSEVVRMVGNLGRR
jgi:hypothetical protein